MQKTKMYFLNFLNQSPLILSLLYLPEKHLVIENCKLFMEYIHVYLNIQYYWKIMRTYWTKYIYHKIFMSSVYFFYDLWNRSEQINLGGFINIGQCCIIFLLMGPIDIF